MTVLVCNTPPAPSPSVEYIGQKHVRGFFEVAFCPSLIPISWKCAFIFKFVDMWARRRPRHVWEHVSNMHGVHTLIWTRTATRVESSWPVLSERGGRWEPRRSSLWFTLGSCTTVSYQRALSLCLLALCWFFFHFIASGHKKLKEKTCVLAIGAVDLFSKIISQKIHKE